MINEYYVYRYIEKSTGKIVYIGKTQRLSVTDRLKQHKDDNVGKWTATHDYYIDFIILPTEEDMNYLESYLIRQLRPELNIMLINSGAPPFSLNIPESSWIKLDDYYKNKEKIKELPKTLISNNIIAINESNRIFNSNVDKFIKNLLHKDKMFIKQTFFLHTINTKVISADKKDFTKIYGEDVNIEEVANRLIGYNFESRVLGRPNSIDTIGVFDEFIPDESRSVYIFICNPYFRKIIEKL